jgi:hypothetical protein
MPCDAPEEDQPVAGSSAQRARRCPIWDVWLHPRRGNAAPISPVSADAPEQPVLDVRNQPNIHRPRRTGAVICAGCAGKPTTLAQCAWDEYTLHRHHRVRDAVVELGQRAERRAPGSQMPGADIWRVRPNLVAGYALPATPSSPGRDRRAPARPLDQAPSDRGRQRPPRPGCLIPCHPVSPGLVVRRHTALFLLHVLLQFPGRKRPSPCRERALTCGN